MPTHSRPNAVLHARSHVDAAEVSTFLGDLFTDRVWHPRFKPTTDSVEEHATGTPRRAEPAPRHPTTIPVGMWCRKRKTQGGVGRPHGRALAKK